MNDLDLITSFVMIFSKRIGYSKNDIRGSDFLI